MATAAKIADAMIEAHKATHIVMCNGCHTETPCSCDSPGDHEHYEECYWCGYQFLEVEWLDE